MRYIVTLGDETLVEGTDYTVVDNSDSATEVGEYTLTIQAVDTETEDAIGTVTVTVSSTNIQDITLTINVNATNKIVPTGTPGFSKTELTYGDPLSAISISGTMTDPITNEVVTGAFEWNTPDKTMDAVGTYEATWKFTPDNAGVYAVVTGTVNITVNKATLTGAPKYTTISTSGKKLSDAALTVNDKWPAGTLEWVDEEGNVLPGATEVKVNTIYKSEGSHSFEIVWTDGTASTSFTVAKNTSGNNGGNNNGNNNSNNSNNDGSNNAGSSANTTDTTIKAPKTGDTSNDALWIVLLVVVSLAGLSGFAEILAIRKKKDFE